jgi:hypothetical protein
MANLVRRPGSIGRTAVIIAAGLALLLPLPARCAPCIASAGQCPRCVAADGGENAEQSAPIACCQQEAAQATITSAIAANQLDYRAHACGCVVRSMPRSVPAVEKLVSSAELLVAHWAADFADNPSINAALPGVPTPADSPPSVPHRILHCSWII